MARKMQQEWREDMLNEEKRRVLEGRADQLLVKPTSLVCRGCAPLVCIALPPVVPSPSPHPPGPDPFASCRRAYRDARAAGLSPVLPVSTLELATTTRTNVMLGSCSPNVPGPVGPLPASEADVCSSPYKPNLVEFWLAIMDGAGSSPDDFSIGRYTIGK